MHYLRWIFNLCIGCKFTYFIEAELQSISQFDDANDRVEFFNKAICVVLDRYCPVTVRMRKDRPCAPWYDDNIHLLKSRKRRSERKWKKTNKKTDRDIFIGHKDNLNSAIVRSKSPYWGHCYLHCI